MANSAYNWLSILLVVLTATAAAYGEEPNLALNDPTKLLELSIEDLMEVEISLVSKQETKLRDTPAAVYVLTTEDIRRSGATSIPEALRMVPGIYVGQVNAYTWSIGSRGFNGQFSDKLLVMIDGRTVYSPLFSGVYWNIQQVVLEDVERIEIVRGPGGTLWGSNAVNGIINIVTKSAKDTQGGIFDAAGGNVEQGMGTLRYGGKLGENAWFRVYSQYLNHDNYKNLIEDTHVNEWRYLQSGFRIDWETNEEDSFTFQGDIFRSDISAENISAATIGIDNSVHTPGGLDIHSGNLLGRWTHTISEDSEMSFQIYYDNLNHDQKNEFWEYRDTFDFDFQHSVRLNENHNIIWGLGYRLSKDDIKNGPIWEMVHTKMDSHLVSGFINDDITLVKDKLHLILGSKFEHNTFSGFEYQPGGRLMWTPDKAHTFWGSITRAVRTPVRSDQGLHINSPIFEIHGNPDMESEKLVAYEAGYRFIPEERLSIDLATFYNVYDDLRDVESIDFSGGYPIIFTYGNTMWDETYGFEAAINYKLADWWTLKPSYSFIRGRTRDEIGPIVFRTMSPRNMANIRSIMNLPGNWQFDTSAYYYDTLTEGGADSHMRLDARLAWQIRENVEFSVVGQNLLEPGHVEFPNVTGNQIEIPRSYYARITIKF